LGILQPSQTFPFQTSWLFTPAKQLRGRIDPVFFRPWNNLNYGKKMLEPSISPDNIGTKYNIYQVASLKAFLFSSLQISPPTPKYSAISLINA